jgi:hypothetical protein
VFAEFEEFWLPNVSESIAWSKPRSAQSGKANRRLSHLYHWYFTRPHPQSKDEPEAKISSPYLLVNLA